MSPFVNRTDRLYAIVEELRANGRRGRTAAWLARRFEVSPRTIKRDIAALQSAGTPIAGQDGRGGGYQLSAEALPPVTLTSAEACALAIALGADLELPFAPDGRTALTKLLRTMSASQRAEVSRIAERVWVRTSSPSWRGTTSTSARTIDEAVRRGVAVTIDYEDGVGRLTQRRRIDPLAIARTAGRWYVLAWCHTRRAGRWFRFDRIRKAMLTRTPVQPRELSRVFGEPPADAQPISYRLR
jgi:predicted DNA-binding transcriptional regulator YafY